MLGNAPSRAVATLRPNGRPTEKESLSITPVRASATFSLSTRRNSVKKDGESGYYLILPFGILPFFGFLTIAVNGIMTP